MIRSNLPLPFLYRLNLRLNPTTRRARVSDSSFVLTTGRAGSRPVALRRGVSRPGTQQSIAILRERFLEEYEKFTGLLCASAMYGCDADKESQYAQTRYWFVTNYFRIADRVRVYLAAEFAGEGDSKRAVIVDYAGQKRSLDPLETLFCPGSLREVLQQDNGDLIPHVERISAAVYRCYEDWSLK